MTTALNPARLDFSTNWNNKLDCQCFTTLRLSGRLKVGAIVEVWEKNTFRGEHRVLDKKRLDSIGLISDWLAYLDTGYNGDETRAIIKRMHGKITKWDEQPIYYYLLQKVKKV